MTHRTLSHRPLDAWVRDLLATAAGLGALAPLAALANPTGGQVVAGNATIATPGANGMVITQGSQNAIINWQQFSIGSGQYVRFVQPNSSAVVLNRVTGGNVSQILGDLSANGQVFLVNPNGIFFGRGATLDVQGFVGSTLDISDSDFLAGHYRFRKGAGAPDAQIINQGAISTGRAGYVVLAGDYVENDGSISAQVGRVVLAAGGQTTLTLDQDQLVSYVVDRATLSRLAGVDNAGTISADGGGVLMTADVANALTATAVNNSGLVAAHSVQSDHGVIVLTAQGGDIENSGTLDASAIQAGVAGGTVILRGDGRTTIDSGAVVRTQGDQADGGFIELSGHGLSVRGQVDPGRGGSLLIDPSSLQIVAGNIGPTTNGSIGVGFITTELNAGVDVVLVASNVIHAASTVTTLSATTNTANLTIKTGTLAVGGGGSLATFTSAIGCALTGVCKPGTAVVFTPTSGAINLSGVNIQVRGAFTADAQQGAVNLGNVTAGFGSAAAGNITIVGNQINTGVLTGNGGFVHLTGLSNAGGTANITVNGAISGKKVKIQIVEASTAAYGGHINVTGNINAAGPAVSNGISISAGNGQVTNTITTGNLTANGLITVNQSGHGGSIHVGKVVSNSGSVHMSGLVLGISGGGGNVSAGTISAAGGVQIQTTATNFHDNGGNINVGNVTGQFISLNANARNGAKITTGNLTATGTGTLSKDVSLFAHASGNGASSHAYNASSGGNITVNGNITGHGKLNMNALGGIDSGGNIHVTGNINVAGLASMLAVNEGSFGGTVSIGGSITAKFVDVTARANWGGSSLRGANTNGAHVQIGGNVTATGTALTSASSGVTIHAGVPSFANGNPSITVHGKVTASNGAVNIFVDGKQGSRSITIGNGSAGSGSIKAQRVHIGVQGSGSGGNIDVGAVTTLGNGFHGDASIQTTGNGGSAHINVHGAMTVAGSGVFVSNHGNGNLRSVSISGAVNVTGAFGNVNITATNSASYGGVVSVGNITANGGVRVFASGRGAGGAQLTVGTVTGGSISLGALNHGGGSAAISAGNLMASRIQVDAGATAASGQAAHITLGSVSAVNATDQAFVAIDATGKADTIATGKLTVSGHARPSSGEVGPQPVGALLQVVTHGGASDSINIGGAVKVTALGTLGSNAFGDAVVEIGAFAGSSSTAPVANAPVAVGGNLTANAARDVQLFVHGSMSGAAAVTAGRNINEVALGLAISATGITLQAGNNINLASGSVTVGSGAAPGIVGDHGVTNFLGLGSINPNAAFIAGGTLNLGALKGSASYVQIRAGNIGTLGTVTLGSGALVQLTATTNTTTLGVGNGAGQSQYNAADINKFSAYTVVIGNSGLTGTMTVGTANLGSTSITLVDNGAIKASGTLTAGKLTLLAGAGAVSLMANVASTDIVSGADIKVDDRAFTGKAALSINSTGVGQVSYNFGAGSGALASNVKITGALTLTAKGILDLTSDSIHAGGAVTLGAGQHILLGNTKVKAGGSFSADAHGSISDGGSGASITAAGATFKSATGNVVLQGVTLNVASSKLAFSAAGSVALGSAAIHAGNMTVAVAGDLNMTSATLNAANLQAVAGGSIDLSGDTVAVSGTVKLTAGFVSSNQALAAKDIVLSGINLSAGLLEASAGGTIHNGGATGTITAGALAMIAGHDIDLSSTQINVGSGSVSGVVGDPFAALILLGAGLGGTGAFPNATFIAGGSIQLAGLAYSGKTAGYRSYLYIQADQVSITGKAGFNPGSLIQLLPFTLTNSMGIEDSSPNGDNTIYLNQGLLGLFAGDTILLGGSGVSGDVDIGENGAFKLGPDAAGDPTNLIIGTSGAVTGLGLVTSTGLVTTLAALAGSEIPPVTSGEIDPSSDTVQGTTSTDDQKKQLLLQAVTGSGPQGGTVSQDTGSGVCH